VFTVKDKKELLNVPFPANLYQAGCRHTLYDTGCLAVKASFTFAGTVSAGATAINIPNNLTQAGAIAPPAAPTVTTSTPGGVNLPPASYYVRITYVTGLGETAASPATFVTTPKNGIITVTSPATATGATGWNVYVGNGFGGEMKQNSTPIAIGSPWAENAAGIFQGIQPPGMSSDGYFTKGVITFTSGANNGLSRRINLYTTGNIQVSPGFPSAPAAGDTFSAVAGCDKTVATCTGKFNNVIHFGGQPYVPEPETGI